MRALGGCSLRAHRLSARRSRSVVACLRVRAADAARAWRSGRPSCDWSSRGCATGTL